MKLSESDVTETPFSDLTTDPGETDVEGDLEQTYLGSQLRQVTAWKWSTAGFGFWGFRGFPCLGELDFWSGDNMGWLIKNMKYVKNVAFGKWKSLQKD